MFPISFFLVTPARKMTHSQGSSPSTQNSDTARHVDHHHHHHIHLQFDPVPTGPISITIYLTLEIALSTNRVPIFSQNQQPSEEVSSTPQTTGLPPPQHKENQNKRSQSSSNSNSSKVPRKIQKQHLETSK